MWAKSLSNWILHLIRHLICQYYWVVWDWTWRRVCDDEYTKLLPFHVALMLQVQSAHHAKLAICGKGQQQNN